VVPGDARCAARLGRYKRAECSCTVGDGCRKEIEQRRSRSRSRWRWIGDGDRAADGSTSRACLERVGWGARLLAVQPAEGRSETNSTTTVYTPQACRTRPVRDTSTWLYCVLQACFFASLRYDLRRRVLWLRACPVPQGRATQPTQHSGHCPHTRQGGHRATGQARMERGRREVCGEPSDCIPFGQRGSVQDLHMIST
jgi:hypothetical protein